MTPSYNRTNKYRTQPKRPYIYALWGGYVNNPPGQVVERSTSSHVAQGGK